MRLSYDQQANVLRVTTDTPAATAASLLDDAGIAVELATPDGYDIVGLIVMAASAYIPLDRGYNAENDTLLMGKKTNVPKFITQNGDITGHWQADEEYPNDIWDPIGVVITQASKHFANIVYLT